MLRYAGCSALLCAGVCVSFGWFAAGTPCVCCRRFWQGVVWHTLALQLGCCCCCCARQLTGRGACLMLLPAKSGAFWGISAKLLKGCYCPPAPVQRQAGRQAGMRRVWLEGGAEAAVGAAGGLVSWTWIGLCTWRLCTAGRQDKALFLSLLLNPIYVGPWAGTLTCALRSPCMPQCSICKLAHAAAGVFVTPSTTTPQLCLSEGSHGFQQRLLTGVHTCWLHCR